MALNSTRFFLLASLLIVLFSCKRSKIQKSIAELPKNDVSISDSIKIDEKAVFILNESDFDYLKLKSKIDFRSENISQSFPANVHIKKDSVIWISVSVGIEAARCLITQDSIQFMDRINRKHYALSIADLSTQFNFDFNFDLLQSLLVGNLPVKRKEEDQIEFKSLYTSLFQQAKNIRIENQVDNVNHKLTTILADDLGGRSKLGISYSDFIEQTNGQLIPHAIFAKIDVIKGDQIKTTTLDFRHTKFEFLDRDLRFPYTIPKSYQKGEIDF